MITVPVPGVDMKSWSSHLTVLILSVTNTLSFYASMKIIIPVRTRITYTHKQIHTITDTKTNEKMFKFF